MAQLIVRNVDDRVVRALKVRAAEHNRSAEAEHRELLREVLLADRGGSSLKDLLLQMPAVGTDRDFARNKAKGRRIALR